MKIRTVFQKLLELLSKTGHASHMNRSHNSTSAEPKPAEAPDVFDVALYILRKAGAMSAMKLQKLVYYGQAWSLVWDDVPLVDNRVEAWVNGPVFPDLYEAHRGEFRVTPQMLESRAKGSLSETQKETLDTVLASYQDKSPQWLSEQTHLEAPWINARAGLNELERGSRVISLESMAEYYGSLV